MTDYADLFIVEIAVDGIEQKLLCLIYGDSGQLRSCNVESSSSADLFCYELNVNLSCRPGADVNIAVERAEDERCLYSVYRKQLVRRLSRGDAVISVPLATDTAMAVR